MSNWFLEVGIIVIVYVFFCEEDVFYFYVLVNWFVVFDMVYVFIVEGLECLILFVIFYVDEG